MQLPKRVEQLLLYCRVSRRHDNNQLSLDLISVRNDFDCCLNKAAYGCQSRVDCLVQYFDLSNIYPLMQLKHRCTTACLSQMARLLDGHSAHSVTLPPGGPPKYCRRPHAMTVTNDATQQGRYLAPVRVRPYKQSVDVFVRLSL